MTAEIFIFFFGPHAAAATNADTLGVMQTAIASELQNRTDLTDEISGAINSAIAYYQKHKFWFSEEVETASTIAGQAALALPSDLGWVDGLTVLTAPGTLPLRLTRRDWREMIEMGANSTLGPAQPTDYAIQGNVLWLYPTPDNAYTLTMYENFMNAAPVNASDISCWTTAGQAEALIRSRTVADIICHVLKMDYAIAERDELAMGDEPFLSRQERYAYLNLRSLTQQRVSAGRIRAVAF